MKLQHHSTLQGKSILIVEDVLVIAEQTEFMLMQLGCRVVGPAPSVSRARRLLEHETIDAAVLDVNLDDHVVFPLADELAACNIPFVFATGYDSATIPHEYDDRPVILKPYSEHDLIRALTRILPPTPKAPDPA